ncbi:MAG: ABC transporter substrate-binding protein [Brevundimonas sp.]|uniref:ABC transporter substrate-binding protein n=1 Tax=Brevundimonas sp. TaxID=1871086 RepID=UPI00391DEF1D
MPSTRRRFLNQSLAALTLALGAGACGRRQDSVDAEGRVRLRVALPSRPDVRHAALYEAMADGRYGTAGLNVQILIGESAADVRRRLAAGQAEVGILPGDFDLFDMIAEQAPVRAHAALFRRSSMGFAARRNTRLRSPSDLSGFRVLTDQSEDSPAGRWLVSVLEGVENVALETGARPEMLMPDEASAPPAEPASGPASGPAPGPAADRSPEPPADALLEDAGRERPVIWFGDLISSFTIVEEAFGEGVVRRTAAADGYNIHENLIVCPEAFSRDNPEVLALFLETTLGAWREYLERAPEAAHALLIEANPDLTGESLVPVRHLINRFELARAGAEDPGPITPARLGASHALAVSLQLSDEGLDWSRGLAERPVDSEMF